MCYEAHTFKDATSTSAGEPNIYYHLADRKTLQSEHSIGNFLHTNHHQQVHNTNIPLHNQQTAPIEQLRPVDQAPSNGRVTFHSGNDLFS